MIDLKELKKALEAGDAAFELAFTPDVCAGLLAHISHQEQRIAELEADREYLRRRISVIPKPFIEVIVRNGNVNEMLQIEDIYHGWEKITVFTAIAKSSKDQQDNGTEGV